MKIIIKNENELRLGAKSKILVLGLILITSFGLFNPVVKLYAQTNTNYQLLAPLPNTGPDFDPKDGTALGKYLNIMINLIIGLSAVLAVVMIVIGGMEYMTSELMSSKEEGRKRMTNAVLGLLIALGAYALLFTINPDLLNTNIKIPDATVTVDLNDRVAQTYDPTTKKYQNGALFGTLLTGTIPPKCTTNTQTGCLPLFVTPNNSECGKVGDTGCTSTIGLNMNQLRAVQWGCGCSLVITGGTEWWLHGGATGSTSHQVGSSTVDIRAGDPKLDNYLSGGKPLAPGRYSSPVGSVLYEGNHWHIGP